MPRILTLLILFTLLLPATGQTPNDGRLAERIAATATEKNAMTTAAKCPTFTGTVNSGSGIGVSVNWSDANPATQYLVTRAGITFPYPGTRRVHSEVSGCGFGASFSIRADYPDGTSCTINSTGSPPHSAPCTAGNAGYSAAAAHAGSFSDLLAPGTITAIFGQGIASQTVGATALPLPEQLAGVEVYVFFNTPLQKKAKLFYVSPDQVNALLPDGLPSGGVGTLAVVNAFTETLRPTWFYLNKTQPGVFTQSANGQGPAKAYFDQGHLVLYASGLNHAAASTVYLQIGNRQLPASFAGLIPGFEGLYQVNLPDGVSVRGSYGVLCAESRCSQFFQVPP